MLRRRFALAFTALAVAWAQKSAGPLPAKPDLPYLKHASELLATEAASAKEEKQTDDVLYRIDGAESPVRTPLSLPIFWFRAGKIDPARLQLYRLESKEGHREISASAKKKGEPLHLLVTKADGDQVYRLIVDDTLEAGEYGLNPDGSDQWFCFQVF